MISMRYFPENQSHLTSACTITTLSCYQDTQTVKKIGEMGLTLDIV